MSYCVDDCPPYGDNNCEIDKTAAISKIILIEKSAKVNRAWTDQDWLDAKNNGDLAIAGDLTADLPDASPVQIDNKRACGAAQLLVGNDLTITIVDPNVSEGNDTFWGCRNGRSYDVALFYCDEEEIRIFKNVTVVARPPQSVGNNTETQHYNVTLNARLKKDDLGILAPAPTSIFE